MKKKSNQTIVNSGYPITEKLIKYGKMEKELLLEKMNITLSGYSEEDVETLRDKYGKMKFRRKSQSRYY